MSSGTTMTLTVLVVCCTVMLLGVGFLYATKQCPVAECAACPAPRLGLFEYTLKQQPRNPRSVGLMQSIAQLSGHGQRLLCGVLKGAMVEARKVAASMPATGQGVHIADPSAVVAPIVDNLRAEVAKAGSFVSTDAATMAGTLSSLQTIMVQALEAGASVPNVTAKEQMGAVLDIIEDIVDMLCPADVQPSRLGFGDPMALISSLMNRKQQAADELQVVDGPPLGPTDAPDGTAGGQWMAGAQ